MLFANRSWTHRRYVWMAAAIPRVSKIPLDDTSQLLGPHSAVVCRGLPTLRVQHVTCKCGGKPQSTVPSPTPTASRLGKSGLLGVPPKGGRTSVLQYRLPSTVSPAAVTPAVPPAEPASPLYVAFLTASLLGWFMDALGKLAEVSGMDKGRPLVVSWVVAGQPPPHSARGWERPGIRVAGAVFSPGNTAKKKTPLSESAWCCSISPQALSQTNNPSRILFHKVLPLACSWICPKR